MLLVLVIEMAPSIIIRALVVPLTMLALSSHAYGRFGTGRLTSLLQLENDKGQLTAAQPIERSFFLNAIAAQIALVVVVICRSFRGTVTCNTSWSARIF